jgi:hypothetical protein
MDGFESLRKRVEISGKLDDIDYTRFGEFQPAPMHLNLSIRSLDNFIKRRMGGERVDLKIQWTIGQTKFTFDPWSGCLERSS